MDILNACISKENGMHGSVKKPVQLFGHLNPEEKLASIEKREKMVGLVKPQAFSGTILVFLDAI